MSDRPHVLAQQLFGKPGIEDCSLGDVQALANQYPYFAPAQFLLLHKLKQENDPGYEAQLRKAILYFHDPVAFQELAEPGRFYTAVEEVRSMKDEVRSAKDEGESERYEGRGTEDEGGSERYDVRSTEDEVERSEDEGGSAEEVGTTKNEVHTVEIREAEEARPDSEMAAEGVPARFAEQLLQTPEDEEDLPLDEEESGDLHVPVNIQLPALDAPPVETGGLSFEPFHTVDYFASQGIRLSQQEVPKDKFGKQLLSFTEWLKTMKRLPATEMTASVDPKTESKVQNLANDSIHESSVWTEAMAEVWLKQGNTAKAAEVYNKLSLLNPSKKAYFAAKIENLKRS